MPEKLGSGENWSDFDYPAEKSKMLVAYFSAQGHTNCGRTYCGAYLVQMYCIKVAGLYAVHTMTTTCSGAYNNL
ncbi:hypothetical protein NXX77_19535 [Phocaeicola dorei]|nr:hypothetical protein [Phocaeicola dorei]